MMYRIFLASCLPFLFTLNGDFVFDDSEAIIKNKDVTSASWTDAFQNDFWGTNIKSNLSHKSYRPLTVISFRINYWLNNYRLSALQFKATNLIFHVTCSLLVWKSFRVIISDINHGKTKKMSIDIAYTAAMLFSVHPVHVEAICGIVGRADILACNIFFLAFLFYNKSMKSSDSLILYVYLSTAVVLGGISMLFKENGVTVLGFCITYEVIMMVCNETKMQVHLCMISHKKAIIRISITTLGIIMLLYGRWAIMGGQEPEFKAIDNPAAFSDSLFTKVATFNYIYVLNAVLFIWPQWLCYDWSMGCIPLIQTPLDFRISFILIFYLYGVLGLKVILGKQWKVSTKRLLLVAGSLTIIPFLPAANIFYPVGFVIAERILYIPSAGYCLLFAVGFKKLLSLNKKQRHKLYVTSFSLLLLIYSLRCWKRSQDWQTEYQLFVSGLTVCPLNAKVRYNVAKVADFKHNAQWALQEYMEAIRLNPEYYQAMNNLANLLKNHNHFTAAESYLRKAIELKPDFPAAWMNLGIVLAKEKRYDEALNAYMTAMEYREKYPDCLFNLGNLYLELNKTEEAKESWFKAIHQNSSHELAWTNLLALLDNTGQLEKAKEVTKEVLKVLPNSPSVNFAVANIYGKLERYEEAEKHFLKAIDLFEDKAEALHFANLGVLYHRWKKFKLAEEMYQKALQIDPNYKSAQRNLKSLDKIKYHD